MKRAIDGTEATATPTPRLFESVARLAEGLLGVLRQPADARGRDGQDHRDAVPGPTPPGSRKGGRGPSTGQVRYAAAASTEVAGCPPGPAPPGGSVRRTTPRRPRRIRGWRRCAIRTDPRPGADGERRSPGRDRMPATASSRTAEGNRPRSARHGRHPAGHDDVLRASRAVPRGPVKRRTVGPDSTLSATSRAVAADSVQPRWPWPVL